jgi:hypothetical protein
LWLLHAIVYCVEIGSATRHADAWRGICRSI